MLAAREIQRDPLSLLIRNDRAGKYSGVAEARCRRPGKSSKGGRDQMDASHYFAPASLRFRNRLAVIAVSLDANALIGFNNWFIPCVFRRKGQVVPVIGRGLVRHSVVGNGDRERPREHGRIGAGT
jgi:hypothetical protein